MEQKDDELDVQIIDGVKAVLVCKYVIGGIFLLTGLIIAYLTLIMHWGGWSGIPAIVTFLVGIAIIPHET